MKPRTNNIIDVIDTGVIDIGSNSVRLLYRGKKYTAVTRLSEGLSGSGMLSPKAMERTLKTIEDYAALVKNDGGRVLAFGTAPLRNALNAAEFTKSVQKRTGITIDVLSGDREAELAFLGARGGFVGDCARGNPKGDIYEAVIDIGGASTEIIIGAGQSIAYLNSLKMGAVGITEQGQGNPIAAENLIRECVSRLGEAPKPDAAYGVAGTFTSLAAMSLGLTVYDEKKVHGYVLTSADLDRIIASVIGVNADIIMQKYPTLGKLRADIITAGALIARHIMRLLDISEIIISENDNLDGYLHSLTRQYGKL